MQLGKVWLRIKNSLREISEKLSIHLNEESKEEPLKNGDSPYTILKFLKSKPE